MEFEVLEGETATIRLQQDNVRSYNNMLFTRRPEDEIGTEINAVTTGRAAIINIRLAVGIGKAMKIEIIGWAKEQTKMIRSIGSSTLSEADGMVALNTRDLCFIMEWWHRLRTSKEGYCNVLIFKEDDIRCEGDHLEHEPYKLLFLSFPCRLVEFSNSIAKSAAAVVGDVNENKEIDEPVMAVDESLIDNLRYQIGGLGDQVVRIGEKISGVGQSIERLMENLAI
ncbi:hypothetical protein FNV43_RR17630 [Rhamnella rubrinervis]|uniref:Uncharacterized protein n=1 Tax=Rhamnella rubrinervis TaxID=2594499 RepID=A0A8K0E3J1_9ROSA|nr:hypothetical protein FNV43_RR17630 [Rhamnella rubrinervis]